MPPGPPTPTPGAHTITTFAGTGVAGDTGNGKAATSAQLDAPVGLAFDRAGNLFIADGNAGQIRKVATDGVITRVAGVGWNGSPGDGGPASAAQLYQPYGIAFDGAGNLLIADMLNRVRMIDTSGIIHTVAGTGQAGPGPDGVPADTCPLSSPSGVVVGSSGDYYIVEGGGYKIRRVDAAGYIRAYAGTGGRSSSGNGGPATQACFCQPTCGVVDPAGDFFVSDLCTSEIRRIDTAGTIWAFAGTIGMGSYTGDHGPAMSAGLNGPVGMAFDKNGDFFFADYYNNCVREVDTGGVITTVVGNGTAGSSGDGGPPSAALLHGPTFLAFDSGGDLYISDSLNHKVRRVRF